MNYPIPYNEQIERAALAAIQRRGQLFEVATVAGISRESFHVPELAKVFDAMAATAAAGEKIDLFLLLKRLPGCEVFLAELDGAISTDTNFREWLVTLRQFEALRRMRAGALELLQGIESGTDAAGAVAAISGLEETARRMIAGRRVSTLQETAEALLTRFKGSARFEIVPFFSVGTEGAAVLQLHPGEMMVIGARTGYGKTAFACGGVLEQLRAGLVVLYFCTESSSADILARLAAQQSGVSHFEAGRRCPDPAKVDRLAAAVEEINRQYRNRLFIHGDECGLITPEIMRGRCREVETEAGRVDVVIVDFLQGLHAPDFMNRKTSLEQTNYNVQSLHAMLAEFRAAGVVLAQFNRTGQTDRSGNGMPDITWLKDSSLIEQLAHTVAFLHKVNFDNPEEPTIFYSRKTRNQPPFTRGIELTWNGVGYASKPRYDSSEFLTR